MERNVRCARKFPRLNMGQVRQMTPDRCLGTVGTELQAPATKFSGADEDSDSSSSTRPAHKFSVLNLGKRGKKPEFLMKGQDSQTMTKGHGTVGRSSLSFGSGRLAGQVWAHNSCHSWTSCWERWCWHQPPVQLAEKPGGGPAGWLGQGQSDEPHSLTLSPLVLLIRLYLTGGSSYGETPKSLVTRRHG